MATTVVKTIGSGGDYSTLQAWEDAAPANLVTADQVWQGQMISASTNLTASSTILTINGSTVDATRYKELTTASGASFADHANKLTNALRWNSSNGASISAGDNYGEAIIVTEQYARLTKLQIQGVGGRAALLINGGGNQIIDRCIIDSSADSGHSPVQSTPTAVVFKNCLVIKRVAGGTIVDIQGNAALYNCTIVKPSDIGTIAKGVDVRYPSGTSSMTNCAVFGVTTCSASTGTLTITTCRTNQATPPTGYTQIAYDTSTGSGFENITDSTRDFRIKSTSTLKDVGTTDSTNAPTDICGATRPQGSSYDIGAWEYTAAAAVGAIRGVVWVG